MRRSSVIRHRGRAAAAVAVAFALAVTACGGGRSDNNASTGGNSGGSTPPGSAGSAAFTINTSECDQYSPTQGVTDTEIKIGNSGPQAGAYGAAFGPIQRGYKAWIDYVNAEKNGVQGRKISLIAKDDEYKADKTVSNVNELVQSDQVFALFNVVGTPNNLAIRDTLDAECVPNLFVASGATQWGQTADYPWLIGSLPSYATEGAVFAKYLSTTKPNATVGILAENSDFGEGYVTAFNQAISGTGTKVVKEEKYDAGASDVTSQVTAIAAQKPDAVLLAATALACPNALKAIKAQQGWTPIVYVSVTCAVKFLIDLGGADAFAGTVSAAYLKDPANPKYASDPAIQEFKTVGAKYGLSPEDLDNGGVVYGWLAGQMLTTTLTKAPQLTRASVMETAYSLPKQSFNVLYDGITVSTNGATDPFPIESLYIGTFDKTGYVPQGEVFNFEGQTTQFIQKGN